MLPWINIKFVKLEPTLEVNGDIWDFCERDYELLFHFGRMLL